MTIEPTNLPEVIEYRRPGFREDAAVVNASTNAVTQYLAESVNHRPINVSEAYGRTDTAVRQAMVAAETGSRALYFSRGTYTLTGDLVFDWPAVLIGDDGAGSILNLTNGGVIFDATSGYIFRPTIRDLRIQRGGAVAGPALHMKGGLAGLGVARVTAHNVHCSSVLGEALLYEGCYIGTFTGCYFEASVYGIRGILSGDSSTGTNALAFFGGESNSNQTGWDFQRACGVAFYGFCTEGNTVRGGRVRELVYGFTYHGGYFEANNGPDIEVDASATSGGIVIEGNTFFTTGATKTESVLLKQGRVWVGSNLFHGLEAGDCAIRVNETSSPVTGEARNNMRADGGTVVVKTAGGTGFTVT